MKTNKEKLIEWIMESVDGCAKYWAGTIADYIISKGVKIPVRCKECLYSKEQYGKLVCIQGMTYRNTYNDPNMFCSYGEIKGENK